jgi:hypothetical protein
VARAWELLPDSLQNNESPSAVIPGPPHMGSYSTSSGGTFRTIQALNLSTGPSLFPAAHFAFLFG